jgi:hypothetical protein
MKRQAQKYGQWDVWDKLLHPRVPSVPSVPNSDPSDLAYCSTYRILDAQMGQPRKTLCPIVLIGEEILPFGAERLANGTMGHLGHRSTKIHVRNLRLPGLSWSAQAFVMSR